MTKFKATLSEVTEVEIISESEKTVTMRETTWRGKSRREYKESDTHCYFDTWEQARNWAYEKAHELLTRARRNLEIAQGRVGNIKGWKPPTP